MTNYVAPDRNPFAGSYRDFESGAMETHLTYSDLFYPDLPSCPNSYKLGRIDNAPALRAQQGLDNQTLANVSICATDKNVCSHKNMYPLRNATCTVPLPADKTKGCQTSSFNTRV